MLIGTGFQRDVLAVAAAGTSRDTRRAVEAIGSVAALPSTLGVGVGTEPEDQTESEVDSSPDPVPDVVPDPMLAETASSSVWSTL